MLNKIVEIFRRADRSVGVALALTCVVVAGASALVSPSGNHDRALPLERPVIPVTLEPEQVQDVIVNPSSLVLRTAAIDLSPLLQRFALDAMLAQERCLAEAMYYEARGEGEEGERAIAEVVFHRMKTHGYPHSVCGVVYERAAPGHGCQFTFTCDGEMDAPKRFAAWVHAKRLAARILGGLVQLGNETEDAIAFHATGVEPGWGLVRTIQIGNHVFYRAAPRSSSS